MQIPSEFDSIRPYQPEELPAVFDRLLADQQFVGVVSQLYPGMPLDEIRKAISQCNDNVQFQRVFVYTFLKKLLAAQANGIEMDTEAIDVSKRYTFISNHRDIILDSAFLSLLLLDAGCSTTTEIGIGDNLPWIEDLVRVNKAFIVRRSLTPREFLASSKLMSEYMHFAIGTKHENIWIAQREGRAKDSNDRTQVSVLKMMCMGYEGTPRESLKHMHIVPLTISYEYDPTDYLKAEEFQQKRDNPSFKKSKQDDLKNMKTGIFGSKGRIHYQAAPCINAFLDTLPDDMTKAEFFPTVARYIDHCIYRNYRLFPGNYVALDLLQGTDDLRARYTAEEKATFCQYLDGQLAKIQIDNKDNDFLRGKMLEMYANPARHQLMLNK